MYQYFITFRRNTHISQKLLENYLDKMQEFISDNINWKEKLWIVYNGNINVNLIYQNLFTSSTVQTIGSKKVNIWTQGQKMKNNSDLNNSCTLRKATANDEYTMDFQIRKIVT